MTDLRKWGCLVEDSRGYPQYVTFMADGAYEANEYAKSVWGDRVRSYAYPKD